MQKLNGAEVQEFRNPGFGRRKALPHNKGRQLDSEAVSEVKALLPSGVLERDLLIEYLHLIQDEFGHLSARHLFALGFLLRLSQAEIFEVASFYAHFDVVLEGESAPPPLTLRVCDSLSCALRGSRKLLDDLRVAYGDGSVRVLRGACMGRCDKAPVVAVGHNHVCDSDMASIMALVSAGSVNPLVPSYKGFCDYCAAGGYDLLRRVLAGSEALEEVLLALEESGLRGLGGAGFPTARKWRLVRQESAPRVFAVNGDEGEPGTIKDLYYLSLDPHRFLEGVLIAARAVEAEDVYIYIRDEYAEVLAILRQEIVAVESAGLVEHTRLHLRRGAGAYICGEESAMIESIEGKRGLPRHRPPFVASRGIFGRPTLVNNVETLYWVREIAEKGGAWFQSFGRNGRNGLRSFSVSGRVKSPGVKLAPAGISVRELIDEYCDGMLDGHVFKAYLPGGASGGILPAHLGHVPLDFDCLQEYDCFIGSAAIVILSQRDNVAAVALNLLRFFEDESCGQCTPCRVGTEKAVALLQKPEWDASLLRELSQTMMQASICGLGQAAPNPLLCVLKYFPEDIGGHCGDGEL